MPYADKKKQLEYQRIWTANRRAKFFRDKSCVKCGSKEDLELDHIDPKLKVSHKIWSWSEDRRLAEIAKCQVLCSTCHLVKTVDQTTQKEHGITMYTKRKCRCSVCVEANRVRVRRQRKMMFHQLSGSERRSSKAKVGSSNLSWNADVRPRPIGLGLACKRAKLIISTR